MAVTDTAEVPTEELTIAKLDEQITDKRSERVEKSKEDQELIELKEKIATVKTKRAILVQEIDNEIDRLTLLRQAKIDEAKDKIEAEWRSIRLHLPDRTDHSQVEEKIHKLYDAFSIKKPDHVILIPSPPSWGRYGQGTAYAGTKRRAFNDALERLVTRVEERNDPLSRLYKSNSNILWRRRPNVLEGIEHADLLQDIGHDIIDLEFSLGKSSAYALEKPIELHIDASGRPSSLEGPAVIWRDGRKEWWFEGVTVTRSFVELEPTISMIRNERNQERKRVLLERYGFDRYLDDAKATMVQEDKYGKIWRIPPRRRQVNGRRLLSEEEVYVQVFNATPEPDGSIRTFLLRVPPGTRTAREAVAWTFGLNEKEYDPKKET